jgi:16S rRNA (uracil1498-N3)-methyltransferase
MQRFYVEAANIRDGRAYFSREQVKYLHKVLRLKEGAEVAVTNGLGQAYLCRLHSFSPEGGEGVIIKTLAEDKEPRLEVVLYQGVSKGDKMDHTVQKSVELGVKEIIPVLPGAPLCTWKGKKLSRKAGVGKRLLLPPWNKAAEIFCLQFKRPSPSARLCRKRPPEA